MVAISRHVLKQHFAIKNYVLNYAMHAYTCIILAARNLKASNYSFVFIIFQNCRVYELTIYIYRSADERTVYLFRSCHFASHLYKSVVVHTYMIYVSENRYHEMNTEHWNINSVTSLTKVQRKINRKMCNRKRISFYFTCAHPPSLRNSRRETQRYRRRPGG